MIKQARAASVRAASVLALGAVALTATGTAPHAAAQAVAPVAAPAPEVRAAGERIYNQTCMGCHAESGDGNPGVYPPLNGSEWVTGPASRLLNILLHGITGPIMVAGEEYSGLMPGWAAAFKDEELAALATYMRSAWGNVASPVAPAEVAALRAKHAARTAFWTVPELLQATADDK